MKHLAFALAVAPWVVPASAAEGPDHYSLLLTGQQVIAISRAIGELPYKDGFPLMQEIQRQLEIQIAAWRKEQERKEQPK